LKAVSDPLQLALNPLGAKAPGMKNVVKMVEHG